MALTKEQKGMIKTYLDIRFSDVSHPDVSQAAQTLIDDKVYIPLFEKVNLVRDSETFERDFLAGIEEWESRQIDEVKVKRGSGLIVGSTVGKERVRENMEARQKALGSLARRREALKNKELMF